MLSDKGLIFDIQDLSMQDGPGIRTTIFFKGCPLKCKWCSNPEGQNSYPELMYLNALCKKSYRCIKSCPYNAVTVSNESFPSFNYSVCKECDKFSCVDTCYPGALKKTGMNLSVQNILTKIKPNLAFYKNSNGGVTLSGGEPLMQSGFVEKLIDECTDFGISVGIETCGYFNWEAVKSFIDNFEFYYYDLKCIDESLHKEMTGLSNKLILNNLKILAELHSDKITVSVPVIPGFNNNDSEMKSISAFCNEINIKNIRLLPYHRYGLEKYQSLGRNYEMDIAEFDVKELEKLTEIIKKSGINCHVE